MDLPQTKKWGLRIPGRPPTPSEGAAQHYSRIGPPETQKILFFKNGTTLSFGPDDPVDEFDEHHPFREQISEINNGVQAIQPFRLRYQGAMNPDKGPDAAVWEGFRTMTLDPATQQTVTLDSGTYRQTPSKYATFRDTLSVYSNEMFRPGHAHRLLDPLGDSRFATASSAELDRKKEIAKRAREIIKREEEERKRSGRAQPMKVGRSEATSLGEHRQDKRNEDPRYGSRQFNPQAASAGIAAPSTTRHDLRQPRSDPPQSFRARGYGARRGRGYNSRGRRGSTGMNPRPFQRGAPARTQEPDARGSNNTGFSTEGMNMIVGHTFTGETNDASRQASNTPQPAADLSQKVRYLVPVPVLGPDNKYAGYDRLVQFTAEGIQSITQINAQLQGSGGAVPLDPSLYTKVGQSQPTQTQSGDAHLDQNALPSYTASRQIGLGIRYGEGAAMVSAETQPSLGNTNDKNGYSETSSGPFATTRQFDSLSNTHDQAIHGPSPALRRVDTSITVRDEVTGHSIHPAQTASSLNTPRLSEISQDTAGRESIATSATTQTVHSGLAATQGHASGVNSTTLESMQTYQATPSAVQPGGHTPSAVSESVQPPLVAPTPIRRTSLNVYDYQEFAELDHEYGQWLDEEDDTSERYDGSPVDCDRVPSQHIEDLDTEFGIPLRRMNQVDVHHEEQSLLARRAPTNNLRIVPPRFVPRFSGLRLAVPQGGSSQAASPRIPVPQNSQIASPQATASFARTPRSTIPQVAALQASSPQIASSKGPLSPAGVKFSPDQNNEYLGYTIFGQQPGQISRDPSPVSFSRRAGRRLFESRSSTPALMRTMSYESRRSSPGPQSKVKLNKFDSKKGGPSS